MIFMKMSIQDVLEKLTKIEDAINIVEGRIDPYGKQFPGQEPLYQVIDLLKEYGLLIRETKVDI